MRRRKGGKRRRLFSPAKLAVAALLVLPLLYFAFTRIFFDPFEEPHGPFDRLVPREVDLFVRREALASDFTAWPSLRLVEALTVTQAWKEFERSQLWQGQTWPAEVEALLGELDAALSETPLDVLDDVLGRELVVLAEQLESPDTFAVLARLSNRGKFAVESASVFEGMLRDAVPGLAIEERSDPERAGIHYLALTLPDGGDLFLDRDRDLLAVSRDEGFLREILATVRGGTSRSLALERMYNEHLPAPSGLPAERFSAAFVVEFGELVRVLELRPNLLDPDRDLLGDLWPRLVDPGLFQRGLGRLELEPAHVALQAHAEVDTELARASPGGLAGADDFRTRERLGDVLALMPWDVAGVVTANVRLEDLLGTLFEHLDPQVKQLVEERVRRVGNLVPGSAPRTVQQLVDQLGNAFGDELTVAFRQPDHEVPAGQQPLPLLAFLLPVQSAGTWKNLEQVLLTGATEIGFDTEERFQLDMGGALLKWLGVVGLPFEEFAYVVVDDELAIFCTDRRFAEEIVRAYQRAPGLRTLGGERDVQDLLARYRDASYGPSRANLALWFDMGAVWRLLEPYARYVADLGSVLDHATLRARERQRILAAEYPQYSGRADALPDSLAEELAERLDAYIDAQERRRAEQVVPAAAAAWKEGWAWRQLVDQLTASLRLGERDADLQLHVATALRR